jgi:phosphatidylglycerol:prolipoprotein diacylglycerol transferase
VPIPYHEQPHLWHVHAFGVLVAVAVATGAHVLRRRALHEQLDPDVAARLAFRMLDGGFAGAHLFECLVYEPADTFAHPWVLLVPWRGISSFGGFLGAAVALVLCTPTVDRWRYIDAIAYAFTIGWIFGRAGCAIAYDHPGSETHGLLAWTFRDGVPRHNLGFYEMLYFIPLAALFVALGRRSRRFGPGFFVGLLGVLYAPVRFGLDFLRAGETTYAGLTPAQWGCFVVAGAGLAVIARSRSR